jgi:tellurite resistance protein
MDLDTSSIRRLRDRLLSVEPESEPPETRRGGGPAPSEEQLTLLERIGPLVETLFLTMEADGARDHAEKQAIRNAIHVLAEDLLPGPLIEDFLARLEGALEADGRAARLEALASRFALDRGDAETAFTLAAAVALSDGRVDEAERGWFEEMRRTFGISAERAAALLEGAPAAR